MIWFVVGFVLGAFVGWLFVSWVYVEHLKAQGYLDGRGRWIDGQ